MKKIAILGSCLSLNSAKALAALRPDDFSYSIFPHLKISYALGVLDGTTPALADEQVAQVKETLARESGVGSELDFTLKQHGPDRFAFLRKVVARADVVMLDLHYEARKNYSMKLSDGQVVPLSISNVVNEGPSLIIGAAPDGKKSATAAIDLVRAIAKLNPTAKIIVLNYPVTAYRKDKSIFPARSFDAYDVQRIRTLEEFGKSFSQKLSKLAANTAERTTFVNKLAVPKETLSKKGKPYFDATIYDYYAGLIAQAAEGSQDGVTIIDQIVETTPEPVADAAPQVTEPTAGINPYKDLPERNYWRPAVADKFPMSITALYDQKYPISLEDKVATCGSCFAQHIGRFMANSNFNYLDVEPLSEATGVKDPKSLGFGLYSARYGNVYTSRQLVQLFNRAFGTETYDEVWQNAAGKYVDPFRPNLCGDGYDTAKEMFAEQSKHLTAVKRMFKELDVFVFTMGLTEFWANRKTGAAYPICPGVTAGEFSHDDHEFINLSVVDVISEMETFIAALQKVNPSAKVLLTVSPVPLVATAEDRHVIVSTTASKSVLRAAAEHLYRSNDKVDYFPSYEVITAPAFGGMFFEPNKRGVRPEGVEFVMTHFFAAHQTPEVGTSVSANEEGFCDEEFLDAGA